MTSLRDKRICKTCRDGQLNKRQPPRTLVKLPTTGKNGVDVYVCPFCDGPAIEFAKKAQKKREDLKRGSED